MHHCCSASDTSSVSCYLEGCTACWLMPLFGGVSFGPWNKAFGLGTSLLWASYSFWRNFLEQFIHTEIKNKSNPQTLNNNVKGLVLYHAQHKTLNFMDMRQLHQKNYKYLLQHVCFKIGCKYKIKYIYVFLNNKTILYITKWLDLTYVKVFLTHAFKWQIHLNWNLFSSIFPILTKSESYRIQQWI